MFSVDLGVDLFLVVFCLVYFTFWRFWFMFPFAVDIDYGGYFRSVLTLRPGKSWMQPLLSTASKVLSVGENRAMWEKVTICAADAPWPT